MESQSGDSNDGCIDTAQGHYLSVDDVDVQRAFRSMDDPSNLDGLMQSVQARSSKNFVVDFSDDGAWAAFDLAPQSIATLFNAGRPQCFNTRWLNVWGPFEHRPLLELLARRYDMSPRLLALMASDPKQPKYTPSRSVATSRNTRKRARWNRKLVTFEITEDDAEKAANDELSEHSSISSNDSIVQGNLYKIVSDLWHYSSVDFGRNYVCLGYNSLYGNRSPANTSTNSIAENDKRNPLPNVTRVWTWIILCEDGTVISIHEDPFPYSTSTLCTAHQGRIIAETRRNLVNVFRSLSIVTCSPLLAYNPLTLLPIRTRLGSTPEETAHRTSDAPGLLFYYLFENWHNSYTLITRRESRYGIELAQLRKSMFQQPTFAQVDRLDAVGKELGVLRRHYESYKRLIDRLLEPLQPSAASLQNSQVVCGSGSGSGSEEGDDNENVCTVWPGPNGGVMVRERDSLLGVSLSSAARVRFRRLRDQIELYAICEVEEYLKQKESLVNMTFSLIAIKQSVDVDRLTRITLLLTKATILFLPVSFMTGYFSVPLGGQSGEYSVTTFWISFAAIFCLSYTALFLFGVMNGNLQTLSVVKRIGRGLRGAVWWVGTELRIVGQAKAT